MLHDVFALFVHTEVGTMAGTDAVFGNPDREVSAHFGASIDGLTIHQYVSLADAAWANGGPNPGWRWPYGEENPNYRSVSIETEDLGQPDTQEVTDAQYATVLRLAREVIVPRWPTINVLVAHRVVNPLHSCPGKRWLDSGRFAQLGADLGLQVLV